MSKNRKKITFFRRFGGSATSTEASAELFRPKMAEASAEASVSVVHYSYLTIPIFHNFKLSEASWNLEVQKW